MRQGPGSSLLEGLLVVDVTDVDNLLCGKLLADMGADVLKVDLLSAGSVSNHDFEGERREWLLRQAYNRGKECVVADLDDPAQMEGLRELVWHCDVLIESGRPGSLRPYGLDWEALSGRRDDLVYVSVTPFGQTGPYSQFAASDIVLQALGGHMTVTGELDRPPLSIGVEIAYRHGGAEAAAAAAVALYHRQRTGLGQHVDVSIQQCIVWTLLNSTMTPQLLHRDDDRGGAVRKERGRDLLTRVIWECKDGLVHFVPIGGGGGVARARSYLKFIEWMNEEGHGDPYLTARDWNGKDSYSITQSEYDQVVEMLDAFMRTKTIADLYARAVQDRLLLAPITRIPDLLDSPQFADRNAFDIVEVDRQKVRLPGPFAILTETPLDTVKPASARGGTPILELTTDRARRVTSTRSPRPPVESGSVFSGIKVADFTWAASGPIITKCLADHGATVVRLESTTHPDSIRMGGPFKDGIPGLNRSGFFADFNTSKKSIAVDLNTSEGRRIARRLVDWADVVAESYTPGVMAKFGLDYETLRDDRPDLVMFSTCMQGQTGRYSNYAGYGGQGAALAGLHYVTGWPDLDPAGPKGAYTDSITPRFGIAALTAALAYRDRTGRGQHIDLSQIEVSLQFLAPELLDYQVNGRVAESMGNRSSVHAPHGAYPCQGEDRWIAIGIRTDEQFRALATVIDQPDWLESPSLRSPEQRRARQDELDQRIGAWTSAHDPADAMYILQRAGVPAGAAQRPSDLLVDPQLVHRGHFWALDHPELGGCLYNGSSFRLSRTPAWPRSSAPLLGHHTREVLTEYLGYSHADVDGFGYSQILQ